MLPRKNVFAFNSCLIILLTFTLVSIASLTINNDATSIVTRRVQRNTKDSVGHDLIISPDLTMKSSATFVYYDTTKHYNLVNDLTTTPTINSDQTKGPTINDDNLFISTTGLPQSMTTIDSNNDQVKLRSTTINSIETQSETLIVTDLPVTTIKSSEDEVVTTIENPESPQQLTDSSATIKPSLTTMTVDVITGKSTIDSLTTTESNLITSTDQGQSTPVPSEITTIINKSNEPTTIKTITETTQSEDNEFTSTTISTRDWQQSTTSDSTSDDNLTLITITSQLPTSIATESQLTTTVEPETTTQQFEPKTEQFTTTIEPMIETTTQQFTRQTESQSTTVTIKPEIETTTQQFTTKTASQTTTVTIKPEIEITTQQFTRQTERQSTTVTIKPEIKTTTQQLTTQTLPQSTTVTIKPEIETTTQKIEPPKTEPQLTTTINPKIEPESTTINTNESTTDFNVSVNLPIVNQISCDCAKSNFYDEPHCKLTCASSSLLANVHINLAFFGIKLATILSNRDYVICLAIGLGCLLLINGFVLRLIHTRKQRKLIAQRNFDILYQDFGTINEKSKQWLADFSYQSSIL